jgi:intermediate cleaving peptidase 55
MLDSLLLAASLGGGFAHPNPTTTPDLAVAVYRQRRARVLGELGGCVAVIAAEGQMQGITEDYRQDADFYRLTGINEPDAYLVLSPRGKIT